MEFQKKIIAKSLHLSLPQKVWAKEPDLGLAISYGIIKMHKGNITFTSETGKGTTFKVVIA